MTMSLRRTSLVDGNHGRVRRSWRDYLRPAAIKAKVITVDGQGQTFDLDCNKIKRFGFHVFRHSLCSFLMAEGENPAVIQATLRHTRRKQKLDSGPRLRTGAAKGAGSHSVATKRMGNLCIMMNLPHSGALNSAVECHPHTVEVVGSNPTAPTNP